MIVSIYLHETKFDQGPIKKYRKYVCDKKGRGTRKKGDFGDYIGRGK